MSRWLPFRWWLDRGLAAAAQVVLSPVLAVVTALVRRDDGGPPLIRVLRVGRDNRPFGMFKIRTMTAATADGLSGGPPVTGAFDDRVTGIGRRLRRTRLDELPQLLNVVRGEMALIGPRPEAPEFVDEHDASWRHVLRAKPGIAGPTQLLVYHWEACVVSGPGGERDYRDVVLPVKLAIDQWYVRRASPWVDALVIASLVQCLLGGSRETLISVRVRRAVPEARTIPRGPRSGGRSARPTLSLGRHGKGTVTCTNTGAIARSVRAHP